MPKARAALPRRVPRPVGLRGRAQPPLQLQTEILRSLQPADQILTDVSHGGGARSEGKHSIEAGNTVGIRRSHIQASADVVQGSFAHPSCTGLHRQQRGEKQVAPGIVTRLALLGSQQGIHRLSFRGGFPGGA